MSTTFQSLYNQIKTCLKTPGTLSDEQIDAETRLLIDDVLGLDVNVRFTEPDMAIDEADVEEIIGFLETRLQQHMPIQYLLGKAECYGLTFYVSPAVLIPRPETELLIERAINYAKSAQKGSEPLRILDLGTGSGLIAVATKHALGAAVDVTAIDISPGAQSVARRNAGTYQADIRFLEGDLFQPLASNQSLPFDIIISNPPYIGELEKLDMAPEVLLHEPHLALFPQDEDRAIFYRRIAKGCKHWLKPDGAVFLELGQGLGKEVADIFKGQSFSKILVHPDYAGIDRVFEAHWA
jgi:release factor glutamine methyltransferase